MIELAFQVILILKSEINVLKMTMTNILKKLEKEWKIGNMEFIIL